MKTRFVILVLTIAALSAFGATWAYQAHEELEELLQKVREATPRPRGVGGEWRPLGEDVGIMLFTDEFGQRGTLYVRVQLRWQAVALQDASELGPQILPLNH